MKALTKPLAKGISAVFGVPLIIVMMWVFIFETGLSFGQILFFSALLPFLHMMIPLVFLIYEMHKGNISDIDITKRQERYRIMGVVSAKNIVSLIFVWFFGTDLMFYFMLSVAVSFGFVFIITLAWKISLHMTLNTMAITLINIVGNWEFTYLYLILIAVAWSRFHLHKHTLRQLLAGFVVPLGVMLSVLRVFNIA